MKAKPTCHFWLVGTVTLFGEGDNQAMIEIKSVYGLSPAKEKEFRGTAATLVGPFPQSVELQLIAPQNQPAHIKWENTPNAGHKFVTGGQIAAHVAFYENRQKSDDLGLEILAWNLEHVFEKVSKDMRAHNGRLHSKRDEDVAKANRERNRIYRVFDIGNTKPLTTQKLGDLAAFFEHRAWPALAWETMVNNRMTVVTEPPMVPAKGGKPGSRHITVPLQPRPDWIKVPRLDELFETVKDKEIVYEFSGGHSVNQHESVSGGFTLGTSSIADALQIAEDKKKMETTAQPTIAPSVKKAHGPKMPTRIERRSRKPKLSDVAPASVN